MLMHNTRSDYKLASLGRSTVLALCALGGSSNFLGYERPDRGTAGPPPSHVLGTSKNKPTPKKKKRRSKR